MNHIPSGIAVLGKTPPEFQQILTPQALDFVYRLACQFSHTRSEVLSAREKRQALLDQGVLPDFLSETLDIRNGNWTIDSVPADLQDRRVEITGPVERKMIINALNSGANVFMADFEDSLTPTWDNIIQGQINLRDAVDRTISFTNPEGKQYKLANKIATLIVRPRGWHLVEKHVLIDGNPISASLFDFGLFFFHNAKNLLGRNTGPYFYLPKMESHIEARLWNDVFIWSQEQLGIPIGTIKATVLIETILAAFEMDEILYELRRHSAGLNCGRWDYIFSCIKKFRNKPDFILADRSLITMTAPFMRAYTLLAIKTCHRRNAHAMGGMAAQIPIKNDTAANDVAIAKVRADKEREVNDGHDGTWVAHPFLVNVAKSVFDTIMKDANQIQKKREDVSVNSSQLLNFGPGSPITEAGLRTNINVALQYLGAWLAGTGAVQIFNLMEDAATAEISRSQIWQWIHSPKGKLEDGRKVTIELFRALLTEELANVQQHLGEQQFKGGKYKDAAELLEKITTSTNFIEFITLPGYQLID